ncbi:MAG: nucleotide sugar dehydrogenase [Gemmatimonadota bacterium]|nr:nucleotide sugar dehydrogenase [Gemmatimonadota bacterium]
MDISDFKEKTHSRQTRICVIGLGYVGLPLALAFVRVGFTVTGLDVSPRKVELLRSAKSDVDDVPDHEIGDVVHNGSFKPTKDYSVLVDQDVVIICVPTPLSKTKEPDLSFIASAVDGLKQHLHTGQLIILESTTYPGTTDEFVLPMLEEVGLKVGIDFCLAFSPERIDPGNTQYQLRNIPKIVGGITPICNDIAATLYQQIIDQIVPVSCTRTAEMVKILENTFRSVNIGLVNETAMICDKLGVDVWETIEAAATKPFGYIPFYPGPGLGGHCIPIDPHYLSWKLKTLDYNTRFIALASEVNSNMPYHVVTKVVDTLNEAEKSVKGSNILILGVAYKPDIGDVRESPAIDIIEILELKGANVSYHDPHIAEIPLKDDQTINSMELTINTLQHADCVVIVTNHRVYDMQFIVDQAQAVVDTRNATKGLTKGQEKVTKL